ncbi:MAG TPA: tetratricopeptide repeat protein [Urbifossiella sp.]|nr:tetratricopeptide repeat protein [Urbifossiella sp.]
MRTAAAIAALLFALAAVAADPPRPSPDDLIRRLSDPSYTVREKATADLWTAGRPAIPALRKAAADPSPEVARRARGVLDRFDWFDFPDTPPDVRAGVRRFLDTSGRERSAAFADLLALGPTGRAAGRAILDNDLAPATRDPLAAFLLTHLRREIPARLVAGNRDMAAELVALHATRSGTAAGAADFAAFHALRGTLPRAVAEAEAAPPSPAADLLLAHLYRATRDWAKARAVAVRVDEADAPRRAKLTEVLLEEQGDWAAARDYPRARAANLPDALRLTYLRLAGPPARFEAAVKEVANLGPGPVDVDVVRDAAHALMLNLRAVEAGDLLAAHRLNPGLLAEVSIARLHYADALKAIDPAEGGEQVGPYGRIDFDLRRARVMALTGDRAGAVKLFGRVATDLLAAPAPEFGGNRDWVDLSTARRALIRSELRSGLRELACEHAGAILGNPTGPGLPEGRTETLFDLLFGADADPAEALFTALLSRPDAKPDAGATMRRVRELLLGVAPAPAVGTALDALAGDPPPRPGGSPFVTDAAGLRRRQQNQVTATALVARAAGKHTEAEAAFAKAAAEATDDPAALAARAWVYGTSDAYRPWVEYGDYLADRGRPAEAAAKYHEGWKRFPDAPLLLFLSGKALVKAGAAAEGGRRIELAHWVPLGNERVRGKFLEELVRRGEAKAAARETDLLLRACWSRDFYFGNVINQAGRASVLNKDWVTAERCVQRAILVLMKTPDVSYVDPAAYLHVPHEMLQYRARGRLAAGAVEAAMGFARQYLDVTPGAVDLAVGMVPDLEKLGRKAEADELFGRVWAAHRKVLTDYPASPFSRNALATLGAGCRRELDAALTYAAEAVQTDPKSAGFRETLAEVHFRRGDRAQAVEMMEALAREYPRSRLYRRQLPRYRTGDPASPQPDAEDE